MATHHEDVAVRFDASATLEPQADDARAVSLEGLMPVPDRRAYLAPDLVGLGFEDAHALAAAARGRLAVSVWQTTIGPWGRVLAQQPEPGSHLRRGARISVTVSGRPFEHLLDVTGLPLSEAIERLVWLGFMPLAEMRHPSRRALSGQVVATRPAAGTSLASGSVVALTVAATPREVSSPPVETQVSLP